MNTTNTIPVAFIARIIYDRTFILSLYDNQKSSDFLATIIGEERYPKLGRYIYKLPSQICVHCGLIVSKPAPTQFLSIKPNCSFCQQILPVGVKLRNNLIHDLPHYLTEQEMKLVQYHLIRMFLDK